MSAKPQHPCDAATLIVIRRDDNRPRIRSASVGSHAFMLNKFVFPGGCLDAADSACARLMICTRRRLPSS
jgi:hypothetical protein